MARTTEKPAAGDGGPHQNVDNSSNRRPKVNRRVPQGVAVYDGSTFVGTVIERADRGGFDAFTSTGDLIGTFSTRIEASRAIPIAVTLDITAAEADGAAS